MAFSMAGAGGSGRRRSAPALAEINVTPFVDVALVLLIIFMITAHVMEYGIDIEVPKTKTTESSAKELPVVQLSRSGDLFLGQDPANINSLVDAIHKKYPEQKAVYLRADKQTVFDPIAQVMSTLGRAGFAVNVVTQPDEGGGPRR
jgi:biopolymer transport protein ExbD